MYAKEVYSVHSALSLRERVFRVLCVTLALLILDVTAESVFSKDAVSSA